MFLQVIFLQLPIAQIYEWLALKHVLIKRCKKLNVLLESETATQMVLFFILSCVGVDRKYRFLCPLVCQSWRTTDRNV